MDLITVSRALEWAKEGHSLWVCTVISTYGSSPRPPGSLCVVRPDGRWIGSLSGGCIEEEFLRQIADHQFTKSVQLVRYGESAAENARLQLPCGGVLEVLVEYWQQGKALTEHLDQLLSVFQGQKQAIRAIRLDGGQCQLMDVKTRHQPRIERTSNIIKCTIGPSLRLIIAGISPVSYFCAQFASSLGYHVVVCDPDADKVAQFNVPNCTVLKILPSAYISDGHSHASTAIAALSHDPRIDDLAMIEAVRTPAFYIGVMGSRRTSDKRAERLQRSGGLDTETLDRIHMPIGLDLGSKTPAEIALSVMADIMRYANGIG